MKENKVDPYVYILIEELLQDLHDLGDLLKKGWSPYIKIITSKEEVTYEAGDLHNKDPWMHSASIKKIVEVLYDMLDIELQNLATYEAQIDTFNSHLIFYKEKLNDI